MACSRFPRGSCRTFLSSRRVRSHASNCKCTLAVCTCQRRIAVGHRLAGTIWCSPSFLPRERVSFQSSLLIWPSRSRGCCQKSFTSQHRDKQRSIASVSDGITLLPFTFRSSFLLLVPFLYYALEACCFTINNISCRRRFLTE